MRLTRLLLLPLAALALTACEAPSDLVFGAKVRAYLLEHPEVLEEALQKLQEKKEAEAQAAAGQVIKKNRAALERDRRDVTVNPDGKITVVQFFDYKCGYCRVIAPEVAKLARENRDVRFVFKDMVIFGATSEYAAAAAREARSPDRYLAVYEAMMAVDALDEAGVDQIVASNGGSPTVARSRQQSEAQREYLGDVHKLAEALGIQGTPAFVVGDIMIPGADPNALREAIDVARSGKAKPREASRPAPADAAPAG